MNTVTPVVRYTDVGDGVMASVEDSKHTLHWDRETGSVHRDANTNRAVFLHLSEHLFHVVAAEMFGGDRDADHTRTVHTCGDHRGVIPATCAVDGAGWQAVCDCGHWRTGWQPTRRRARNALAAHIANTTAETTATPTTRRTRVRIPSQRSAS